MQQDLSRHPLVRLQRKYPIRFDAGAMFLYTALVYTWSMNLHPLGRDYELLHRQGEGLPLLVKQVLQLEITLFGDHAWAYHLVNAALLYACMFTLYALVRIIVTEGPFWLGTLAATLFMANPVHSDAVLNLAGVVDLLPALFALVALTLYVYHATHPRPLTFLAALAAFALAVLPFQANLGIWLILPLYETILARKGDRISLTRLIPFIAAAALAYVLHAGALTLENLDPAASFAPLYFVFYPIGFLPESARAFHAAPWLGWLAAAVTVAVLLLIHRGLKRPAFLFGLLGALACRLFQGGSPVDPVHLIGGGQLLLPSALFSLALVVLFRGIMNHPKWRRNTITFTTLLCIILFVMQIRVITQWRHAGEKVKAFQAEASKLAEAPGAGPLGILPDYRYYRSAPLCLSDAIAYDTPFSTAIPHQALLPLHYHRPEELRITLEGLKPGEAVLRLEADSPEDAATRPYALALPGGHLRTPHTTVEVLEGSGRRLRLSIKPIEGSLPGATLPMGH